jgi:hypothetical protein
LFGSQRFGVSPCLHRRVILHSIDGKRADYSHRHWWQADTQRIILGAVTPSRWPKIFAVFLRKVL